MTGVFNFSAGPAMLPAEVMRQAKEEFLDWGGLGTSVMEISHRSKPFIEIAEQSERDLRLLLNISDEYSVLFMHGGGRGQFSAVPLNLAQSNQRAMHLVSGAWSRASIKEAEKFITADSLDVLSEKNGIVGANVSALPALKPDTAYVHYCPNETVDGICIDEVPSVDVPLVADMSSNILSRTIDVNQYGLIYAGAQKNIGPSGLSVVIIKNDLLGKPQPNTPVVLDYSAAASNQSMFNTPPTYSWYLAGMVFKWLLKNGGVKQIEKVNIQKAEMLYQCIDDSDLFVNRIDSANRSKMNVVFQLKNEGLDSLFLEQAYANGLHALKGHRAVGGMRASIYNAMPLSGITTLVEFMREFERTKG